MSANDLHCPEERRKERRRSALLPMRVIASGQTLFEGVTRDASPSGIFFGMPGGETLSVGDRVWVELSVPAELLGGPLGYRSSRGATVARVESSTLASQVGCRSRACGVALALDAEAVVPAARRREPAGSEVA